ncbi:MAG: 30S ribosomal protein S18 [Myxococcota bacterium]|nr:30S ribosomal protein S18 [Myxococcota bacterium]
MSNYESSEGNERDGGGSRDQPLFARRRRPRPSATLTFSYKDVETIKGFLSEHGKIVPRRISHLSARQQRELSREVKIARQLALVPYTNY